MDISYYKNLFKTCHAFVKKKRCRNKKRNGNYCYVHRYKNHYLSENFLNDYLSKYYIICHYYHQNIPVYLQKFIEGKQVYNPFLQHKDEKHRYLGLFIYWNIHIHLLIQFQQRVKRKFQYVQCPFTLTNRNQIKHLILSKRNHIFYCYEYKALYLYYINSLFYNTNFIEPYTLYSFPFDIYYRLIYNHVYDSELIYEIFVNITKQPYVFQRKSLNILSYIVHEYIGMKCRIRNKLKWKIETKIYYITVVERKLCKMMTDNLNCFKERKTQFRDKMLFFEENKKNYHYLYDGNDLAYSIILDLQLLFMYFFGDFYNMCKLCTQHIKKTMEQ